MKRLYAVALMLAAPLLYAQSPPPLDLTLHEMPAVPAAAASTNRPAMAGTVSSTTAPGEYFGDHGGGSTHVGGSVSAAVGHISGHGNVFATGASLDIDHETADGNHFDLHLHVTRVRAPDLGIGHGDNGH